jgi:hypothetical protein
MRVESSSQQRAMAELANVIASSFGTAVQSDVAVALSRAAVQLVIHHAAKRDGAADQRYIRALPEPHQLGGSHRNL